jgi:hypothetical protein
MKHRRSSSSANHWRPRALRGPERAVRERRIALAAAGALVNFRRYRYWFHRRVGFGADMSVVPTLVLSSAYRSFFFGVQVSSGLELTF